MERTYNGMTGTQNYIHTTLNQMRRAIKKKHNSVTK